MLSLHIGLAAVPWSTVRNAYRSECCINNSSCALASIEDSEYSCDALAEYATESCGSEVELDSCSVCNTRRSASCIETAANVLPTPTYPNPVPEDIRGTWRFDSLISLYFGITDDAIYQRNANTEGTEKSYLYPMYGPLSLWTEQDQSFYSLSWTNSSLVIEIDKGIPPEVALPPFDDEDAFAGFVRNILSETSATLRSVYTYEKSSDQWTQSMQFINPSNPAAIPMTGIIPFTEEEPGVYTFVAPGIFQRTETRRLSESTFAPKDIQDIINKGYGNLHACYQPALRDLLIGRVGSSYRTVPYLDLLHRNCCERQDCQEPLLTTKNRTRAFRLIQVAPKLYDPLDPPEKLDKEYLRENWVALFESIEFVENGSPIEERLVQQNFPAWITEFPLESSVVKSAAQVGGTAFVAPYYTHPTRPGWSQQVIQLSGSAGKYFSVKTVNQIPKFNFTGPEYIPTANRWDAVLESNPEPYVVVEKEWQIYNYRDECVAGELFIQAELLYIYENEQMHEDLCAYMQEHVLESEAAFANCFMSRSMVLDDGRYFSSHTLSYYAYECDVDVAEIAYRMKSLQDREKDISFPRAMAWLEAFESTN